MFCALNKEHSSFTAEEGNWEIYIYASQKAFLEHKLSILGQTIEQTEKKKGLKNTLGKIGQSLGIKESKNKHSSKLQRA